MQISGKIALVTGGGGGIGGGIGEALREKGARVVLADVNLGYAQDEAKRIGADVIAIALDVTSLESWATAKRGIEAKLGAVDILCNNAGIATPRTLLDEVSPEMFARVLAINITGVFNGVKTFAPEMRARKSGHVVNTSSVNGLLAHGTFTTYSASKFAVTGLSDGLRQELAPFNVGVSCLFPGLTRSRMSLSPDVGAGTEMSAETMKLQMMEPVWLGRAVARAIENDEPYIISHPGFREIVRERFDTVLAAFGDPAQPGYTGR